MSDTLYPRGFLLTSSAAVAERAEALLPDWQSKVVADAWWLLVNPVPLFTRSLVARRPWSSRRRKSWCWAASSIGTRIFLRGLGPQYHFWRENRALFDGGPFPGHLWIGTSVENQDVVSREP